MRQLLQFFFQIQHFIKCTHGNFQYGIARIKTEQILMKIANTYIPAAFYGACRRRILTREQFQQCRFTSTVITYQANMFVRLNMPCDIF